MADLIVENIVVAADLKQSLPLQTLAISISDADYNEEDPLLIFRFNEPKRAVLVTSQGSISCTGIKTEEEGKEYITKIVDILKDHGVFIDKLPDINMQSFVVSTQLNKTFDLNNLSKHLQANPIIYNPDQKPWIEYAYDDQTTILISTSGKLVCTSTSTIDHASEAIDSLSKTLLSI